MKQEIITKYNDKDSIYEDGLVPSACIFDLRGEKIPKYTIAIPTFLRTDLLRYTLQSAINQKQFEDYEIVVVDNNPERDDATEQLMQSNFHINGIAYFKNSENLGMSGNWNKLYLLSRTEWVVMLHDDDMLYPDFLTVMNRAIKAVPHVVCFYACYNSIRDNSNLQPEREHKPVKLMTLKEKDYLTGCHVHAPLGMTIKRDVLFEMGGFNRDFYPSLDYHFHVKLAHYHPVRWLRNYPIATYRWMVNASGKHETLKGWVEKDSQIKQLIFRNNHVFVSNKRFLCYLDWFNRKYRQNWYNHFDSQKAESIPEPKYNWLSKCAYFITKVQLGLPKKIRKQTTI